MVKLNCLMNKKFYQHSNFSSKWLEIFLIIKPYSIYLRVYGPTENNFARNPSIFTLLVLRVIVEWFEPDVRANTSEFNVPVNLCILACYSKCYLLTTLKSPRDQMPLNKPFLVSVDICIKTKP